MADTLPSLTSLGVRMQAQWQRHEILANNLANVSTTGFKQDDLVLVPNTAGIGGADAGLPAQMPQAVPWTDFSQGPIQVTGRSLDVALSGPGFLVVDTPRGPRFTRSGALEVNRDGVLALADGSPVLGERGPVRIRSPRVVVTESGEVQEDGRSLDTLKIVGFPRPYRLIKEGGGLFAPADAAVVPEPASGSQVVPGALEGSNVSMVGTMVSMIELLRAYEAYQRAIQAVDEIDRRAVNEIGRIG